MAFNKNAPNISSKKVVISENRYIFKTIEKGVEEVVCVYFVYQQEMYENKSNRTLFILEICEKNKHISSHSFSPSIGREGRKVHMIT